MQELETRGRILGNDVVALLLGVWSAAGGLTAVDSEDLLVEFIWRCPMSADLTSSGTFSDD